MKRFAHKFWFWAFVQAVIALSVVAWRFYLGRRDYLIHSLDGRSYHLTWTFHGEGFLAYAFLFLVVVGLLIGLEWFIFRKVSKRRIL